MRVAVRAHNDEGRTRRRLQVGQKHGWLLFFGEAKILSVFGNPNHLHMGSILQLVMAFNRRGDRAKDLGGKLAIDDRYARRVLVVASGKAAAGQQAGAGRGEVLGRDAVKKRLAAAFDCRRSSVSSLKIFILKLES